MVCIKRDIFDKQINKLEELVKKIESTGFKEETKLCRGYLNQIKKSKKDYDIERVNYEEIILLEWPGKVDLKELKRYFEFKLYSLTEKSKNALD